MSLSRIAWASGVLAVILAGSGSDLSADETPPEQALAKLGLKRAGTLVVLEAESDVHSRISEVRQLYRDWTNAVMRQRSTVSEKEYQSTIKALNDESNALRKELAQTNQMINQIPKYRGRPVSSYAYQQADDLNAYKAQLQWEINQRTAFLNQLKSQPFDPKAKAKVDTEVRDLGEAVRKAVIDLRKFVDELDEKSTALDKNDEVKKILSAIERKSATKLKVGQSRQFHLDIKYLEKLEQQVSTGESAGSTEKSAKKSRRSTRPKRTYRPSMESEDFDSPF